MTVTHRNGRYGQHLRDGYACLSGSANVSSGEYYNVTHFDPASGKNVTVQEPEVLDCTNGFVWFIIFVLFVVAAKAAFAVVMISGSASLVWVAATAAVPLADLWFIAAPATRQGKSSWLYDVLGLVVVLFGLVLWHVKPETKKNT